MLNIFQNRSHYFFTILSNRVVSVVSVAVEKVQKASQVCVNTRKTVLQSTYKIQNRSQMLVLQKQHTSMEYIFSSFDPKKHAENVYIYIYIYIYVHGRLNFSLAVSMSHSMNHFGWNSCFMITIWTDKLFTQVLIQINIIILLLCCSRVWMCPWSHVVVLKVLVKHVFLQVRAWKNFFLVVECRNGLHHAAVDESLLYYIYFVRLRNLQRCLVEYTFYKLSLEWLYKAKNVQRPHPQQSLTINLLRATKTKRNKFYLEYVNNMTLSTAFYIAEKKDLIHTWCKAYVDIELYIKQI